MTEPLLSLQGVTKTFPSTAGPPVAAVSDVSFSVAPGEALGLIGGSGAGKSTVARLIVGLDRPDRGRILFGGRDLARLGRRQLRAVRRELHLVFQDPYASLPPTMTVAEIVAEPLVIHGVGTAERRREQVHAALRDVALGPPERFSRRHPHELSGGERQRVALARALVLEPRLVVADEPTAMLDASLRADLLELMASLRTSHGLAYVFITHDLVLAHRLCDRLTVLRDGRVVEEGRPEQVLGSPTHPYTAALVGAVQALRLPALAQREDHPDA
jgi:peptide/nickel transport system ATP-binding protein